jgi:integrase
MFFQASNRAFQVTALASAFFASPLFKPTCTRLRNSVFCSQSSVNKVRSIRPRSCELGTDRHSRKDAWAMLKRRLRDAGFSSIYSNHSFRAAGITNYLENGGTPETAQRIAGHADSRTTKLYDRRGQKVLLEDMERIRYGG